MRVSWALCLILAAAGVCAVTITTDHYDNNRLAWNSSESLLTSANVSAHLHLAGSLSLDGATYTQPIVFPATISGVLRNVEISGSMNCSVYAFDADTFAQLWTDNLCTARTSYPDDGFFYHDPIGCLATPAADPVNGFVYAACVNSTPNVVLYKLALSTGSTISSVTLSGSYMGFAFSAAQSLPRMGLTLANGNVYIGFSGYDDEIPWNGWAFAYSTANLSQVGIFCTTPSGSGGGIWQAGGGFAVDSSGNLYTATGNGTYDGTANYANSIIKLSPTLALVDWFTPSNYASLSSNDLDMASGRAMLIPGSTLIALGEKDFNIYVIDSACMGHLQGSSGCTAPVIFPTNGSGGTSHSSGVYGAMFMNGVGYWPNTNGSIYAFTFSAGAFNQTPLVVSGATYSFPGAQMSGSSNGAANGLVWATTFASSPFSGPTNGTLRALDPSSLSEYWNSDTLSADAVGHMPKFAAPTVANGKVYVDSWDNKVQVYALTGTSQMAGAAVIAGAATLQ